MLCGALFNIRCYPLVLKYVFSILVNQPVLKIGTFNVEKPVLSILMEGFCEFSCSANQLINS